MSEYLRCESAELSSSDKEKIAEYFPDGGYEIIETIFSPPDPDELLAVDPATVMEREQTAAMLSAAIAMLPLAQAEAVKYCFGIGVREHTQQETADILGVSRLAVTQNVRLGLQKLRKILPTIPGGFEIAKEFAERRREIAQQAAA